MDWVETHRIEHGAAADVRHRFAKRPATWLRPFLLLAVTSAAARSDQPWYRMGAVGSDGVASLHWHPHAGPAVFTRIIGELAVIETDEGGAVELRGRTEDGDEERNRKVLQTLVAVLADALGQPLPSG